MSSFTRDLSFYQNSPIYVLISSFIHIIFVVIFFLYQISTNNLDLSEQPLSKDQVINLSIISNQCEENQFQHNITNIQNDNTREAITFAKSKEYKKSMTDSETLNAYTKVISKHISKYINQLKTHHLKNNKIKVFLELDKDGEIINYKYNFNDQDLDNIITRTLSLAKPLPVPPAKLFISQTLKLMFVINITSI